MLSGQSRWSRIYNDDLPAHGPMASLGAISTKESVLAHREVADAHRSEECVDKRLHRGIKLGPPPIESAS